MFTTIIPTDANYEATKRFISQNAGNFDYNGLVAALNAAPVNAIIKFPYRQGKLASLRNALGERSLTSNVDVAVSGGFEKTLPDGKADENSDYICVVQKTSEKAGVEIAAKPRGKAAKPKGDAAAATTAAPTGAAKKGATK